MRSAPTSPSSLSPDWCLGLEYRGVQLPQLSCSGSRVYVSCGRLSAIDGETGEVEWQYPLEVLDHVLLNGGICAWVREDEAHLIDLGSGEPVRSLFVGAPGFYGQAVAAGDRLLVLAHSGEHDGQAITCFDHVQGRTLWKYSAPEFERQRLGVGAGTVVVGLADGTLRALALDDGRLLWERRWPEARNRAGDPEADRLSLRPIFDGDRIIVRMGRLRLMALDRSTGATIWENEARVHSLHRGHLYGVDAWRYRFADAASGKLLFERDIAQIASSSGVQGLSALGLLSDTHAVVACTGGLAALDRLTGDLAWHARLRGSSMRFAELAGRLFCVTDARRLYSFSPHPPAPRGEVRKREVEPARSPASGRSSGGARPSQTKVPTPRKDVDLSRLAPLDLAREALQRQLWAGQARSLGGVAKRMEVALAASEELHRRGARARPGLEWLLELLGDPARGPAERSEAILLLRESVVREEAMPAMVAALDDVDPKVRGCAVASLRFLGSKAQQAVPKLRDLADLDPDEGVRRAARRALAKLESGGE